MRPRTVVALVLVVVALAGVGAFAVLGGDGGGALTERWVSDTTSSVAGNHHAVAVGHVADEPRAYVPIGGRRGHEGCGLVALDGAGSQVWRAPVPASNCTIHAVADPVVADLDGDGTPEVIAATTERQVFVREPGGDVQFRHNLTDYGYTKPVVADVGGDEGLELVVTDVSGTVYALGADGSTRWTRRLDAFSWAAPGVADFDADGGTEVVVGLGDGRVVALDGATGHTEWNLTVGGSVTWMGTGDIDADLAHEAVVATTEGQVAAVDGRGRVQWTASFGRFAAVNAVDDADGDGTVEVYATARDGKLRALAGPDGSVEWSTALAGGDVQMMPPPVAGDVDGDGASELVAATNGGTVAVVDPADGSVLATYERDVPVWTHPTLADTDGDGRAEVYVTYGDGRVVALAYSG